MSTSTCTGTIGKFLCLSVAVFCLWAPLPAAAADANMRLLGLAMHRETARDIYLGAIHVDENHTLAADLLAVSAPRVMEYRIVARRTSIRSLLGGMLLQSEVATGRGPDDAVDTFIDGMMEVIEGSLYAGDSLRILLTANKHTVAVLNYQEIARIEDRAVSDYLLQGWIGDRAPSTAFRVAILDPQPNSELLAVYEAKTASNERNAVVASWFAELETVEAAAVEGYPIPQTPVTTEPMTFTAPDSGVEIVSVSAFSIPELPDTQNDNSAYVADATEDGLEIAVHNPLAMLAAPDAVQLAALSLTGNFVETEIALDPIAAVDVIEYARRLGDFNHQLLLSVYDHIRYPRAAVRRGYQGSLELDVTLLATGELLAVSVGSSSGIDILDRAAVSAATRALEAGVGEIDAVALAEYSREDNTLIVPVPVSFVLTK